MGKLKMENQFSVQTVWRNTYDGAPEPRIRSYPVQKKKMTPEEKQALRKTIGDVITKLEKEKR